MPFLKVSRYLLLQDYRDNSNEWDSGIPKTSEMFTRCVRRFWGHVFVFNALRRSFNGVSEAINDYRLIVIHGESFLCHFFDLLTNACRKLR